MLYLYIQYRTPLRARWLLHVPVLVRTVDISSLPARQAAEHPSLRSRAMVEWSMHPPKCGEAMDVK
jgi:hypothetical protein